MQKLQILGFSVLLLSAPVSAAPPPLPTVVKALPAADWDARFAGKEGWIGGDGVYSAIDKDGRIIWLFGDTLFGTVKNGKRPGAHMVNNSVGFQQESEQAIRFYSGKSKDNKPSTLLIPADGKGWFWPQAAVIVAGKLYVFLPHVDKTIDPGVLGFQHIGQTLAVVENPTDEPDKWKIEFHNLPFVQFTPNHERSWGSATLEDDQYLYVYGYDEVKGKGIGKRQLLTARVSAKQLIDFATWRFWTGNEWSDKPSDAAALASGMATEFSVSRLAGEKGYMAVYTENGLGDRIVGRLAAKPQGPWSEPMLLYKCPEMAKDKGVFSYAAKAHAWAGNKDGLLISYCVNTWDFGRLFKDELVYRPKWVRVLVK